MAKTMIKPINFQISICKMVESHQETFWLSIEHPDYQKSSIFDTNKIGNMMPYMSDDIDKVRNMAQNYAMLFGLPYSSVIDPYVDSHPEKPDYKELRIEEYQISMEDYI